MNDELFTLIDARGQSAGAALHRAAAVHPWTAKPPKRPVVWVRPALVLAAAVALLAGLVWVARKPTEPAGHTPAGLRYVIGDLPNGWKATEAHDASSALQPNLYGIKVATFGTYDDPTAPYVQVIWQDPAKDDMVITGLANMAGYSNLREVAVGSRVAACGEDVHVVRCAMDGPDGQVQLNAVGLADDRIAQLFGAVQILDGQPFIAPASLPAGLSPLFHGDPYAQRSVVWAWQLGPGPSIVNYSNPSSDNGAGLVTGWADDNDMAAAAMFGEVTTVDVAGHVGYLGSLAGLGWNLRELVWRDGDRTFAIYTGDANADMVALAESVRPATDAEWSSIAVDAPSEPATDGTDATAVVGTVADTLLGETPPPTDPVPDGVVRDVVVTQVVEQVNAVTALYSCSSPDGESEQVQVAVLAGNVLISNLTGGGSALFPVAGTEPVMFQIVGTGEGTAVVVVSTDLTATRLRVTRSDGERYVLDLVAVPGHPELKIGAVVVPGGTLVGFDVVDANGSVLVADPLQG